MACRDGNIYTIKNGQVLSNVIELETQPVGLVRFDAGLNVDQRPLGGLHDVDLQ